jgi:hypothetical protein
MNTLTYLRNGPLRLPARENGQIGVVRQGRKITHCPANSTPSRRRTSLRSDPSHASSCSLAANLVLADAIVRLVPGAQVKCALARIRPVESSCRRRVRGMPGLVAADHTMIRTADLIDFLPIYFVDNVSTTGATLPACRDALGAGTGLAYADAS